MGKWGKFCQTIDFGEKWANRIVLLSAAFVVGSMPLVDILEAPGYLKLLIVVLSIFFIPVCTIAYSFWKYRKRTSKTWLKFIFAPYPPYLDVAYKTGTNEVVSCVLRIGLKNVSHVYLEKCAIILRKLSLPGGQLPPRKLKMMIDNPSDLNVTPHKQEFSLSGEQEEFIDIFKIYWDRKIMQILYALDPKRDGGLQDHLGFNMGRIETLFNLQGISDKGNSLMRTYTLKVDTINNRIQFGELGSANNFHDCKL